MRIQSAVPLRRRPDEPQHMCLGKWSNCVLNCSRIVEAAQRTRMSLSPSRGHVAVGHATLRCAALPQWPFERLTWQCIFRPVVRPSGGMADATDSKSVGGNPMRVRLSPRAFCKFNDLRGDQSGSCHRNESRARYMISPRALVTVIKALKTGASSRLVTTREGNRPSIVTIPTR